MEQRGFTLLEVIIVVSLIAILTVIAFNVMYPVLAMTHRDICVANLKHIYAAKAHWYLDHPENREEEVSWADLVPSYLKERPKCPSGGIYEIGRMKDLPDCSERDHGL